ncbi:DUF835 domain-containing protein [Pyrococcus sp. ST04]|uniref:DUF835 domain-containing protein n=1 Tax=Pyrococcus sp. ST04 TaxID=1183377 RepID=UPI0002605D4C|nr:DUF835 domain-containing protein [Pyrococcus sp. ST04]AFK22469.1 hypothetical protein Py04_0877 [Pyrococcus sp. ST04]
MLEVKSTIILIGTVSIVTGGYFLYASLKEKRKDALYASLGWFMLGAYYLIRYHGIHKSVAEMFLYFYALGMAFYTVEIIEDYAPTALRHVKCYLLVPLSHILYRTITMILHMRRVPVGGIAGDSGFMLIISAYIFWKGLGKEAMLNSVAMLILGIDLTLYKFIGDSLIDLVLILLGALILSVSTIRRYKTLIKEVKKGEIPDINPGMKIVPDAYFEVLLESLEDKPLLLFTRDLSKKSENWTVFYVTNTQMENGIRPTELEKMTHLAVRYMREARMSGGRGVVAIDCLEFLKLYNDFRSIMKFLHALRDYAIAENGTVIVAYTPEAWEEKEKAMLMNLAT